MYGRRRPMTRANGLEDRWSSGRKCRVIRLHHFWFARVVRVDAACLVIARVHLEDTRGHNGSQGDFASEHAGTHEQGKCQMSLEAIFVV